MAEFYKDGILSENDFIYPLTTPIPLSFEAFNSRTICLYTFPYIYQAHARIVDVLPVPGGP